MTAHCPSCSNPLDAIITRAGLSLHPTCDAIAADPEETLTEILATVAAGIHGQPRSHQRLPGPSELGTPCGRRLGYKLAGVEPVNDQGVPWLPFIGTALHEQLANIMAAAEVQRFQDDPASVQRWHVEERVTVGTIAGEEITGTCDLFDAHTGLVLDWKTTSSNQVRSRYRPHGPGDTYRRQAHLYGLGWENAGHAVRTVMVVWLTRDGGFDSRHVWSEPYDRAVALDTLTRADGIATAVELLGVGAIPNLPTAADHCRHCPWHSRGTQDATRSCAGVETETEQPESLAAALGN